MVFHALESLYGSSIDFLSFLIVLQTRFQTGVKVARHTYPGSCGESISQIHWL